MSINVDRLILIRDIASGREGAVIVPKAAVDAFEAALAAARDVSFAVRKVPVGMIHSITVVERISVPAQTTPGGAC